MSDDEGWRDITPTTAGFEYEVQVNDRTGHARHRSVRRWALESTPAGSEYVEPIGPWKRGWPGKGLQW